MFKFDYYYYLLIFKVEENEDDSRIKIKGHGQKLQILKIGKIELKFAKDNFKSRR